MTAKTADSNKRQAAKMTPKNVKQTGCVFFLMLCYIKGRKI